jgi:hypothetical protein
MKTIRGQRKLGLPQSQIIKKIMKERGKKSISSSEKGSWGQTKLLKLHALLGYPVSENFVSWCQTLKNSSASFLCIQETYIISTISRFEMCSLENKGETIHRMYRNRDYFGDGSVHDTWRPLTIQTI